VLPIIRNAQKAGANITACHRATLNDLGIPMPRGGTWAPTQKNILDRAKD
jgi:hypothetical protein